MFAASPRTKRTMLTKCIQGLDQGYLVEAARDLFRCIDN